jgi:manganese/zinc/iron transport system permease protein
MTESDADIFFQIDFPALLTCVLCAFSCSLVGGFLYLRGQAMMTDALSHAVLPGLTLGFILFGAISGPVMVAGALLSCFAAALLIQALIGSGKVDKGAAMAIVFTSFFALGLLLLEYGVGKRVDLDAHHALYGGLEYMYWTAPFSWETFPASLKILLAVTFITAITIYFGFRAFLSSSFDSEFASVCGFAPNLCGYVILGLAAILAVACFEAVGSILVLTFFICPPATARIFSRSTEQLLKRSVIIGVCGAILGYVLAIYVPMTLGLPYSLNAGATIAVTLGLIQGCGLMLAWGLRQNRSQGVIITDQG